MPKNVTVVHLEDGTASYYNYRNAIYTLDREYDMSQRSSYGFQVLKFEVSRSC